MRNEDGKLKWWVWALGVLVAIALLIGAAAIGRSTAPAAVETPPVTGCGDECDTGRGGTEIADEPETIAPQGCQGWDPGNTRDLQPGQSCAGDVVVNGAIQYNTNDTIEGTVVINQSSGNVKVKAPWGAGCVKTDSVTYMVNREFESGCGDGCDSVRTVVITDESTEVEFHSEPIE